MLNYFLGRLFISSPLVWWVFFIMFLQLLNISLLFHFAYIAVFGVPFLQTGISWFLLIVESAPCEWGWTNGLLRFPG